MTSPPRSHARTQAISGGSLPKVPTVDPALLSPFPGPGWSGQACLPEPPQKPSQWACRHRRRAQNKPSSPLSLREDLSGEASAGVLKEDRMSLASALGVPEHETPAQDLRCKQLEVHVQEASHQEHNQHQEQECHPEGPVGSSSSVPLGYTAPPAVRQGVL